MEPDTNTAKKESMTESERYEEIRLLRMQRQETEARLLELSRTGADGDLSSSLAAMAANGRYKCVEINSDGEEIDFTIEGPKKIIDTCPEVAVKTEANEEDPLANTNDTSAIISKSRTKKRKTPITPEYVDATFDSEYAGNNNDVDNSPGECLEFIKATIANTSKAKEMMQIIRRWTEEDQPNIFIANNLETVREARKVFIKQKKDEIKKLQIDLLSLEFEFVRMILRNPISGWKLVHYIAVNIEENIDDIADGIRSLSVGAKGMIVRKRAGSQTSGSSYSSRDKLSIDCSMILEDSGLENNRNGSNHLSHHSGNDGVSTTPLLSRDPVTGDRVQLGGGSGNRSLLHDSGLDGNSSRLSNIGGNPLLHFSPSLTSTPRPNTLTQGSNKTLIDLPHLPKMEEASTLGMEFQRLELSELTQEEVSSVHLEVNRFFEVISNAQNDGRRRSIKEMITLARQGLPKPSTETYFPMYPKEYLASSFKGEPLPGVYLPCGSSLSEQEGTSLFTQETGRNPRTIIELNNFMKSRFEPTAPSYNAKLHVSHIPPYSLEFYAMFGFPLRPPGRINTNNTPPKKIINYFPYNWETARQRINTSGDLLRPLLPFLADPLLTTLAFSPEIGSSFIGLSLNHPKGEGRYIARTKPFLHNAISLTSRLHSNVMIGRCTYCNGVYILPCSVIVLCYFVPDGMKYVTDEILNLWRSSEISVCAVHFLHHSKRPSNGAFDDMQVSF